MLLLSLLLLLKDCAQEHIDPGAEHIDSEAQENPTE
jgi:hypothetical protein